MFFNKIFSPSTSGGPTSNIPNIAANIQYPILGGPPNQHRQTMPSPAQEDSNCAQSSPRGHTECPIQLRRTQKCAQPSPEGHKSVPNPAQKDTECVQSSQVEQEQAYFALWATGTNTKSQTRSKRETHTNLNPTLQERAKVRGPNITHSKHCRQHPILGGGPPN